MGLISQNQPAAPIVMQKLSNPLTQSFQKLHRPLEPIPETKQYSGQQQHHRFQSHGLNRLQSQTDEEMLVDNQESGLWQSHAEALTSLRRDYAGIPQSQLNLRSNINTNMNSPEIILGSNLSSQISPKFNFKHRHQANNSLQLNASLQNLPSFLQKNQNQTMASKYKVAQQQSMSQFSLPLLKPISNNQQKGELSLLKQFLDQKNQLLHNHQDELPSMHQQTRERSPTSFLAQQLRLKLNGPPKGENEFNTPSLTNQISEVMKNKWRSQLEQMSPEQISHIKLAINEIDQSRVNESVNMNIDRQRIVKPPLLGQSIISRNGSPIITQSLTSLPNYRPSLQRDLQMTVNRGVAQNVFFDKNTNIEHDQFDASRAIRSDMGNYQQAMIEEKINKMEQEVKLEQIRQLILAKNIGLRDAVQLRMQLINNG
ncbi:hypothetical protein FGO68_gene3002 [Halteria grandinella]|uniref:Uncharacterized protein n=1 Tax=Halteria grandinella TaxID=5974 RepID=A0A8J8P449_HALGN|nr:hypothetical protein FGO68_gene3002 [Halteria grandinella]